MLINTNIIVSDACLPLRTLHTCVTNMSENIENLKVPKNTKKVDAKPE